MYSDIEQFKDWLACQYPAVSTRIYYSSDLVLFFAWARKSAPHRFIMGFVRARNDIVKWGFP